MTAPSSQPDARTVLDDPRLDVPFNHVDGPTLREVLLAQVERLEQERDEARAERSTLYQRGDDFAHDVWKERAVAAEARAVQAEREAERWHREALDWQQAKSEADDDWEEAEARAQRYREALTHYADEGNDSHDIGCLRHPMHWPDENDGKPGYERIVGGPNAKCTCAYAVARRALSADPLVCRDPNLCWGTGTCPRDPACNE